MQDYVAAIPGAFNSVLNLCGFGKLTKGECIHMALQQSLDLYENPLGNQINSCYNVNNVL